MGFRKINSSYFIKMVLQNKEIVEIKPRYQRNREFKCKQSLFC